MRSSPTYRAIVSSMCVCIVALQFVAPRVHGQSTPEDAVLAVAQQVFDGINGKDAELLRAAMHPDGRLLGVPGTATGALQWTSTSDFVDQISTGPSAYLERMWDPEVRIDGPIASVWAPYDFHRDGEFSHCGIDSFELIRTDAGWRVVHLIYTLHPEGECAPSPLGPPGG